VARARFTRYARFGVSSALAFSVHLTAGMLALVFVAGSSRSTARTGSGSICWEGLVTMPGGGSDRRGVLP
jgi:hypothetical protein